MPLLRDAQVIEAVNRTSRRAAAAVHQEMQRGLSSLATMASIAPLAGVLGTVVGIPTVFKGCAGDRFACMAAVIDAIATALVPVALGLLVALQALWCYRYLSSRVEAFDTEMENSSVHVLDALTHLGRRDQLRP